VNEKRLELASLFEENLFLFFFVQLTSKRGVKEEGDFVS
jgi:hypothetical protein